MVAWKYIRNESLLIPLAAIVLLTNLLVSPVGNFPLNDDWVYAKAVQDILETGRYSGHPYSDALFVLQAYWGALFCLVFGFSFTVLRLSTLVTLLIAAWGASASAKATGIDRNKSLLMGAVFLSNPIVMNLSYTFMTDIPFLALAHLALLFFIRAYQTPTLAIILTGSTLAALAYCVRQFGLLLPIAYAATLLVLLARGKYKFQPSHWVALAAPWILVGLMLMALPDSARGLGTQFDWNSIGHSVFSRFMNGLKHWTTLLLYLSLFLTPVFLLLSRKSLVPFIASKRVLLTGCSAALFLAYLVITPSLNRMPLTGNMLYDLGVGPLLLRGIVVDGALQTPLKLGAAWWIPTLFGLAATLGLFAAFLRVARSTIRKSPQDTPPETPDPRFFLFMLTAAYLTVLFIPGVPVLYDRYFLMALVPLGIFILLTPAQPASQFSRRITWLLTACIYLFSIIALQDYMAWNTARWQATDRIQEHYNVTPEDIDGGYEFNGWLTSDQYLKNKASSEKRDYGPKGGWLVRDTYAVSFLPRENFNIIDELPYDSWLGFEERNILILERFAEDEF